MSIVNHTRMAGAMVALGALIPGVTTNSQDVGGTQYGSAAMAIHGSTSIANAHTT